jgi:hypothetical protein
MNASGEILNEEFLETAGPNGKRSREGDRPPLHRLWRQKTDDRQPAGFVSTFREFSKHGNVGLILFDS